MSDHPLAVHITWMTPSHMKQVVEIERLSSWHPWNESQFVALMRQRNGVPMVAEYDRKVVGFYIFEIHRTRIILTHFAVHPAFRNRSVGRQMMDKVKGKLTANKRPALSIVNRETLVDGSLFLRAMGFKGALLRGHFDDEDGIIFTHKISVLPQFLMAQESVA